MSIKVKFFPFYLLSILPFWILYLLSDLACFIVYRVFRYRRDIVRENLSSSFPEKGMQEIKIIEKSFYKHFCDQMFESIKVLTISKDQAAKRLTLMNPELISGAYSQKKSIILYTGHFGNWEWTSFLPLSTEYQLTAFYKPLSNRYYDQLMKSIRQRFGLICIESKKGYKTLAQLKQKNILTMSLLLSDQSPGKDRPKVWVPFLNRDTAFVIGADRIAKKMDKLLVFPSFRKARRGHYELTFQMIDDRPQDHSTEEIVTSYARTLEQNIIESPELWLWSHKRWKLSKATE